MQGDHAAIKNLVDAVGSDEAKTLDFACPCKFRCLVPPVHDKIARFWKYRIGCP
jgi:hypothetical protein